MAAEGSLSVGVAAHISAASPGGPRYDPKISERERRSRNNGIWLCANCAREIDGDAQRYSVAVLRLWRVDAEDRAHRELGQPTLSEEAARFAAIGLDPQCMWAGSHRLGKIAALYRLRPETGFHAIPEQAWADYGMSPSTHAMDPIFDLTIVNDSATTTILSEIGFEIHSVWSDLKGLTPAYKVSVLDGYVLKVSPIVVGDAQRLRFPDPIAVRTQSPVRIKLTLADFRANLPGNECLLRFIAIADSEVFRSRLINVGVY